MPIVRLEMLSMDEVKMVWQDSTALELKNIFL